MFKASSNKECGAQALARLTTISRKLEQQLHFYDNEINLMDD